MNIIIIDNYDSFTYNIVAALRELGVEPRVVRNDVMTVAEVLALAPDGIIISPGPGIPSEAGIVPTLLEATARERIPVLGVCLGLQAIAEASGSALVNLPKVYHGVATPATLTPEGRNSPLFASLPDTFAVGRYHSWAVDPDRLSADLVVTATSPDGCIMAAERRSAPQAGVQFHPESVLTPEGSRIFSNWLDNLR